MTFEKYEISQGSIVIAHSDKTVSVGYLVLSPGTELAKHNRPVTERLFQIKGSCVMKLFDGDKERDVVLKEGDSLEIPPEQFHIHSNPGDKECITMWKAEGDITEIINKIRESKKL